MGTEAFDETVASYRDMYVIMGNSAGGGYTLPQRLYMAEGTALASALGFRGLSDMCYTHDAVRGHEQSGLERATDGINGAGRVSALASLGLVGIRNVPVNAKVIHGNSLNYVGESHVYAIRGPKGAYKIGQSMQGVRKGDGASIRGEAQARALTRKTGDVYVSEIRKAFPNKRAACKYETRFIERFRRMFGDDTLPGNKTNR